MEIPTKEVVITTEQDETSARQRNYLLNSAITLGLLQLLTTLDARRFVPSR
jgi:hypothetical protein